MIITISKDLIASAIDKTSLILFELSNTIKDVVFPDPIELTVETSRLNDKYISELLKPIPAGYAKNYKETDFIYVFEIQGTTPELQEMIYNGQCNSRNDQNSDEFEGKKDFCRDSHSNSIYLYVGRSQKLRSRLKQHLDAGSVGIFAMHMLRWSSGIDAKIKIYCYRFDQQATLIMQALEDSLWDSFLPMFGRKGEK